jgi:hypothetical protein
MTSLALARSRNPKKRAASEELYDTNRFNYPSFRDGGADQVKSEEEPVDLSFVPQHGEHGFPCAI